MPWGLGWGRGGGMGCRVKCHWYLGKPILSLMCNTEGQMAGIGLVGQAGERRSFAGEMGRGRRPGASPQGSVVGSGLDS